MKKYIFLVFILLMSPFAQCQTDTLQKTVFTDSVRSFSHIDNYTFIAIDSSGGSAMEDLERLHFFPLEQFTVSRNIPSKLISATFYLKFRIFNRSGDKKIFFYYPGKLFKNIDVYLSNDPQHMSRVDIEDLGSGFIKLQLNAGEANNYVIRLKFFKSDFNEINSTLITRSHIENFKSDMYKSLNNKKTAGILLSGMLLMMILVTLLNYFITRKIEFLFSSLYSLCMFLLIFLTSYLTMNPSWFKGLFISYLDLFLLIAGTIAYISFTRHFLNTRELYPKLNRFLKLETLVITALMAIYSIIFFGTDTYHYEIILENLIKILLLLAALVYIFLSLVQKNPLMNYLAIGVATQIFFSIISLVFVLTNSDANEIYTSPIFYFELGVICAIVFFLLGLFYKNRQELIIKIKEQEAMKLEVEKQSFENKLTIYKTQQEERNRISADMHDDLGAGMTSIRLYSELAKSKMAEKPGMPIPEIEKISSSADELINNMNSIIWSMSSQNDSMGNMVAYIRSYAIEYLENTGIKAIVTIPDHLPELVVSGTIRRNVFLVVKEALQNVIKHSKATEVSITMTKEPEGFALTIHDNGNGIDFKNLRQFSNGLKNMKKRMQDINIEFTIENNAGTLVRLYAKTR